MARFRAVIHGKQRASRLSDEGISAEVTAEHVGATVVGAIDPEHGEVFEVFATGGRRSTGAFRVGRVLLREGRVTFYPDRTHTGRRLTDG